MPRKGAAKPWATKEWLEAKYVEEELSCHAIAKLASAEFEGNVYANTVRRALKSLGIGLRTKSQAQSKFLEKNTHPMEGKERTDEEKKRISEGIQKNWDELTDDERQKRRDDLAERARMRWEWMPEDEQEKNIANMHKANREKSGKGSRNENTVADMIFAEGYVIVQRSKDYAPGRQFEIDIAIPSENIAIEWDGAAHFVPIYGEKDLARTMEKDGRKNKALMSNNWTIIRCRDHSTAHSMAFCRRNVKKIIDVIKNGAKGKVHYIDAE
jgi:very-short-patch-repair endonuclease